MKHVSAESGVTYRIYNRILLSRQLYSGSFALSKNLLNLMKKKYTSKDGLPLGGGICHITATLHCMHGSKQVPACVHNIVLTR